MARITHTAILEAVARIRPQLIHWRRQFHSHPALGLDCHRTGRVVAEHLDHLGLEVYAGVANSGVVALLRGGQDTPVVGFRVDMDALPIQEKSRNAYVSQNSGIMHACGHDGHTSMGLGVATTLAGMRTQLPGTVKFIFQPGEESPGGAKIMIAEGVLENPPLDAVVSTHIHPSLPSGHIGVCRGTVTAGCAEIEITLHGVGGHAARPHECRDPVTAAGHLLVGIQTIASRRADPAEPIVVTIGSIQGGTGHNIIPEEVTLKGTIRFVSAEGKETIKKGLADILRGVQAAYGVSSTLKIQSEEAPMKVSDELTEIAEATAVELLAVDQIHSVTVPSMGAEDFSRFSERVPAAYFRLGCHDAHQEYTHGLHTPRFDFDEEILVQGTAYAAFLIYKLLKGLPLKLGLPRQEK
ncbi:MAG: amidohydrolase [Deltaproteobacteria bacterium]|nr:amidohydrolase [Deltaproteobacteria bacterium]